MQPKLVLTTHGFAAEFAKDLRQRGHDAWLLEGTEQLELNLVSATTARSLVELPSATTEFLRWLEMAERLQKVRRHEVKLDFASGELAEGSRGGFGNPFRLGGTSAAGKPNSVPIGATIGPPCWL